MNRIDQLSAKIDDEIAVIRRFAQLADTYNTMMHVAGLGELIMFHRDEVKKELEGLRGDVKAAESAYEAKNAELVELRDIRLPEWRKRVTSTERANDDLRRTNEALARNVSTERERANHAAQECELWKQNHDRVANELKALALHAGDLEQERDEWKRDAEGCDNRTETANQLIGTLKNENDSLKARLDYALGHQDVLRDAYENQKTLTRNALNESRQHVDEHYELKKYAKNLEGVLADVGQRAEHWEKAYYAAGNTKPEDEVGFKPITPDVFRDKYLNNGEAMYAEIGEDHKHCIQLEPAEIQSGLTRVRWAEMLIRQMPDSHEGAQSWLLNYARR